jgi:hypothetical protein
MDGGFQRERRGRRDQRKKSGAPNENGHINGNGGVCDPSLSSTPISGDYLQRPTATTTDLYNDYRLFLDSLLVALTPARIF